MIFPAIDLMDGGCVRLLKGDFGQRTNYDLDPVKVAQGYAASGAEWVHVVDLDGAKNGQSSQTELIIEIAKDAGLKVQTGGGLRELSQLHRLINGGIERCVIGSLAVTNPQMVKFWLSELGPEKIVIALDINIDKDGVPRPATKGWTEASPQSLWSILDLYAGSGLKTILVTDIGRDGVQSGSNVELYEQIMADYPTLDLITSGGVGTLKHVKELKMLNPHGIIIGKALYEGNFTVEQAIKC
ncbi:1-(5-phosphoribosyl)-5-[(5-phosphoribosylamino)methylideneamino]imidazole-4-carboxamide isomerase [Litorimonas sp. RW-G-Af-16]|uniref:1-(5-phosphoribosyl)-5-[(5- phosphoribosylamino)methylideneamino]imidazole-4- carboxamide isomerase n=1 Tax=Litorimonas sp. RW-G-Af-16 TaxID=3241168 RepID=UPI00390CCEEA